MTHTYNAQPQFPPSPLRYPAENDVTDITPTTIILSPAPPQQVQPTQSLVTLLTATPSLNYISAQLLIVTPIRITEQPICARLPVAPALQTPTQSTRAQIPVTSLIATPEPITSQPKMTMPHTALLPPYNPICHRTHLPRLSVPHYHLQDPIS